MSRLTALLDANILYPAPMRDLFIQLATQGLFQAKWTADIHREWINALLRNEPWRDPAALHRTRELMNRAARDCLVTGYEQIIPVLSLPDADDRHVLAAAIVGQCDVIVTHNVTDFPASTLARFGIEAQHPDPFLAAYVERSPTIICEAIKKLRARLVNPPIGVEGYLATLSRQGLTDTVIALEPYRGLL